MYAIVVESEEQERVSSLEASLDDAEENLALARRLIAEQSPSPHFAYLRAWTAAEEFLRSFLAWHRVELEGPAEFPLLVQRVSMVDSALASTLEETARTVRHSIASRGDAGRVGAGDAVRALELAERVREAVRDSLGACA